MGLRTKQEISKVETGVVNQVGHDLVINSGGLCAADVIAIVKSTVSSELAIYSMNAETAAKERLQKFSDDLVTKLSEKVADKLGRFNEPSLQFTVREAALGYVRSGHDADESYLIDLMIERVKVEEHSTKQKLIDQAIKIVPTLSAESLAILSMIAFRQLAFKGSKTAYVKWLNSMNCLVDIIAKASSLDVEYLIQAGCASAVLGLKQFIPWEQSCLKGADLFFRHPLPEDSVSAFFKSIGIAPTKNGEGFSVVTSGDDSHKLLLFVATTFTMLPSNEFGFNLTSSTNFSEALHKYGLDHIMPLLTKLRDSATPYSAEEVVRYFESLNPNWRNAIELLNSEQLSTLKPTPVGAYIGSRQLAMLSGMDIPLEIFYS